MAIAYDAKEQRFQVDYQSPFGGIDSSAYASAINPQNFASLVQGFSEDNILKPIGLSSLPITNPGDLTGTVMAFVPVNPYQSTVSSFIIGYIITSDAVFLVQGTGPSFSVFVSLVANYTPATSASGQLASFLLIDNHTSIDVIIYWTDPDWSEIWQLNTLTGVISLTTNYIGGGLLNILNDQLIVLGGNSALDGAVPNRISWSAPGQYGVFQPYDVPTGTGNYAAGFNDLPSTSDTLTGFAAIGTVGYILRSEGITQMTPTGNGIQPFQFNHLWASDLGVGTIFPNSVSQLGTIVCFISDNGFYKLGLDGLDKVGAVASTYIYSMLNKFNTRALSNKLVIGKLLPYINTTPGIFYVTGVIDYIEGVPYHHFVLIDVEKDAVYDLGLGPVSLDVAVFVSQLAYFFTGVIQLLTKGSQLSRQISCLLMYNKPNIAFYYATLAFTQIGTFIFRKEQLKFGYIPTVSKLAVLGSLIDTTHDGNISFSIDGGLNYGIRTGPNGETLGFPDIAIVAGVGNPGQGIIDNIYSDGVVSIQRPQLALKLTNVQVAEAWYQGTLADFSLI